MRALILLLIVSLIPAVSAAGLVAQAPADGATVDPEDLTFSFSSAGNEIMESCALFVDGEEKKRLTYRYKISSLSYKVVLDEGTHEWYAECITEDGDILTSAPRGVVATTTFSSDIELIATGERGVFIHEFRIQNVPEQPPVVIPELYPGDFISIIMLIPPSKITKELFIRGRYFDDDGTYLWLTHGQQDHYVHLGKNVSIPMGSSEFTLHFKEMVGTKITMIAYPKITGSETTEQPEEDPPEEPEEIPYEEPEEPEEVVEEEIPEEPEPSVEPAPTPRAPEQTGFQKFLSWLSSIFGS